MERRFCPQAYYQHREIRRINTNEGQQRRSTICTPGGRGWQKVTVQREEEEQRKDGKSKGNMQSPNDDRPKQWQKKNREKETRT